MTREDIIRIITSRNWELINFEIIIHFGKNPKNGGKPPKERREAEITIFEKKLLFIEFHS